MTRALNTLVGLAVGDALGMPTQSLSRADIAARYGRVDRLLDGAPDQPIAPGMPAGSITDDTEQALLLADLLVEGGGTFEPRALANDLQAWEDDMRARGSSDLLGPSTKASLVELAAGASPEESGRFGTTNGAAMRIAPVGIAFAEPDALLEAVVAATRPTHNTGLALSTATTVAAVISAGIDGADLDAALDVGLRAGDAAFARGHWRAGASVPAKARWALAQTFGSDDECVDFVVDVIGTSVSSQESAVAAIVLAHHFVDRPFEALCQAASVGGDTDTVAAIAGAMLGATADTPPAPTEVVDGVLRVSQVDSASRALALTRLRDSAPRPS